MKGKKGAVATVQLPLGNTFAKASLFLIENLIYSHCCATNVAANKKAN